MLLPGYVNYCIERLESAGFAAYAVGGCVRDACLGILPQDYDLCTAALPEQTEAIFADHPLVLAGKKHGTVGVVTEGGVVEITTFRTEGAYRDSRHPDWVAFVPKVETDLARRDFTVNAMAFSPIRGFADPFGGREDLKKGILRAVGDPYQRFSEDALRILRGIRFAVRYRLDVEADTGKAMLTLSSSLDRIAAERIFDELCKLLPLVTAEDLLRFAPVLAQVIPELCPTFGYDQRNPHHIYDLYTHTAQVTGAVPPELPLRWAALLHDVGKPGTCTLDTQGVAHYYGHAKRSTEMADAVLRRLKAPTLLREQVLFLIGQHMTRLEPDKKLLRRRVSQYGMHAVQQLLALQQADCGSKGTGEEESGDWYDSVQTLFNSIREEDACLSLKNLAVNGHDLMALGFSGREIGNCLNRLLEMVMDEQIPNEKTALLTAASMMH